MTVLAVALLLAVPAYSPAASVVLKIRAINPSRTELQSVEVRSYLPAGVKAEDVIDPGELVLAYDATRNAFYVHGTVELAPKEVRTLQVELNDIWTIPESTVKDLREHARVVADSLANTPQRETGRKLAEAVDQTLAPVLAEQARFAIPQASPLEHIRAYEANVQALDRARRDIGRLENLAIGEGKALPRLLGSANASVGVREPPPGTAEQTVTVRIEARNPSPTEVRTFTLRRDLPQEIKPDDVVEPGDFEVGFDFQKSRTYVQLVDLALDPLEAREFEVRIRNKWVVDPAYLNELETRATNVLAAAERGQKFEAIEDYVRTILADVEHVRRETPPAGFGDEYVAFYRQQAAKLADVDSRVVRVETLLHPKPVRPIFDAEVLNIQPPNIKTTWRIIYTILIFLGVMSLLFFLRWHGKSQAERR